MIRFNRPLVLGREKEYLAKVLENRKFSGDGEFTQKCNAWFEEQTGCRKALLTTSCTHALEMAAILAGIGPGDEVIMASYTFTSTANAFILRGASIVFIDVRPDTMNMDEALLEAAVTDKTKAIVVMHYGGVACEMDTVMNLAAKHGLVVIEDAAQGIMATYKKRPLGGIGHLGCFSFHETKNYQCGEGGALLINDERFADRAEMIREKGTNRSQFYRGQVDKYTWQDLGSSYLPSEMNAAFLYAQLEHADAVNLDRVETWNRYREALQPLAADGRLELVTVPDECIHNGHLFYLKLADLEERTRFIAHLKEQGVLAVFHYIPLHSAPAGKKYGRFCGDDRWTTRESERLVRLPMFYGMTNEEFTLISEAVKFYFG